MALSIGLLVAVAYRSFINGESSWDLMGLVVLGGLIGTGYRARQRVLSGWWALLMGVSAVVALALAFALLMAERA